MSQTTIIPVSDAQAASLGDSFVKAAVGQLSYQGCPASPPPGSVMVSMPSSSCDTSTQPYLLAVLAAGGSTGFQYVNTPNSPTLQQILQAGVQPPDQNTHVIRLNNSQTNALLNAMNATASTQAQTSNTTPATSTPNMGLLLVGAAVLILLLLAER